MPHSRILFLTAEQEQKLKALEKSLEQAHDETKEARERALGLKRAFLESTSKRDEEAVHAAEVTARAHELESKVALLEEQLAARARVVEGEPAGATLPSGPAATRRDGDMLGMLKAEVHSMTQVQAREAQLKGQLQAKLSAAQKQLNALWAKHLGVLAYVSGEKGARLCRLGACLFLSLLTAVDLS